MRRLLSSSVKSAVILFIALATAGTATLVAQSSLGSLRGTVKEATGVIPGATVQLINDANGVSRETISNETGQYSFPAVDPGTYTVKVTLSGFKSYERKGIVIGTQVALAVDVTLEIGTVEENILVTASSPIIDTTTASTGDVLDTKELESIPSPGRSVFLMANLEPTVQESGNAHWNRMQDQIGNSAVSIGGGPVRANNYLIDGFPVTDLSNRASTNPSIEAVDQMKVQVHTYDAETGRTGGGIMNMTAKSGANQFHGGAYTVFRPESMVEELLQPKLQGQPNQPEYWRDGGGGVGGPIIKNKLFFFFAGEKYTDNQPQASSQTYPTALERTGDFNGVTRSGKQITITNPLTGLPFDGNIIPGGMINPVTARLLSYYQQPDQQVDNGNSNFTYQDLLPNRAYQYTTKIDEHFNERVSLSGFFLRQVTHEASTNYNPVNAFVGGSYQLDRVINTLVVNNTYVVSPSTVLMVRGGYNHFDDNYNLNDRNGNPLSFNMSELVPLGFSPTLVNQMTDSQRFPNITMSGSGGTYHSTGWNARQANGFYQYGANAALTHLVGDHNLKFGADWRKIGTTGLNYGSSTGSYTFNGQYTGNPVADMLLGYPSSGSIPINKQLDGYVNYYSAFAQDEWRLNKLTVSYGVRLERETGFAEKGNQISVNFDQNAVNPLNKELTLLDPVTGLPRTILGGLVYAGVNGAPTVQGNQPAVKIAPRVGAVYSLNDKTVIRGGWGLYFAPYNYPSAGTTSWGQIGYSATTNIQQTLPVPTINMNNPFPAGLVQPTGNSLGLLTGTGGDVTFIDPNKGAPRVYQYSFDIQRELPGNVSFTIGYTGLTGRNLSWEGSININQLDPKYYSMGSSLTTSIPNPFYGIADAGQFGSTPTIARGQLLRPFPEFGNVTMSQSTGAKSQYNAMILTIRKRTGKLWGGNISYTLSRLNDNQFGSGNYYSSNPGLQNNYTVIPGSAYYNPDAEYGRSLLDSPHKIVIAPTINLPLGKDHRFMKSGILDILFGDWSATASITLQAGFPMGVTQQVNTNVLFGGTPRPNIVDGVSFLNPGDITDRIVANCTVAATCDNVYFNAAAFSNPGNAFGNEPRILPGVYSPWRKNTDLGVSKLFNLPGRTNASVRMEVLNLFNQAQWAAPNSSFGSSSFGRVTSQANNARMIQFTIRYQF